MALFVLCGASRACSVPVFRYALERWESAPYEATIFFSGKLDAAQDAALKMLKDCPGNLSVQLADVDKKMDEPLARLWKSQAGVQLPWLVVEYPESNIKAPPAWSGALNAANAAMFLDSPARKEIVRRILAGDAVIWLLLESGDKERDEAIVSLLKKRSGLLAAALKLPAENQEKLDPDAGLRSEIPLKIAFSTVRIPRADPGEQAFATMLLRTEKELAQSSDPIVFPIFGRGRVLQGLREKDLKPENIDDAAAFLTGACSCQVKELNPGIDLLINTNWERSLASVAPLAVPADRKPRTPPAEPLSEPKVALAAPAAPVATAPTGNGEPRPIPGLLLWVGVVLAAILVFITGNRTLRGRTK